LAQATATLAITFPLAYAAVPFAVVSAMVGTGAGTIKWNVNTLTATVLTLILDTVPVTLLTYVVSWSIQA
jgi:ABC-type arginine transport system permease subunit